MPAPRLLARLLLPVAAVALTATAFTGVTAAPAHADDYCDYEDSTPPVVTGYSPNRVVVGLEPALVTFHVSASDKCGIDDWIVEGTRASVFAYKANPTQRVYGWSNSDAGYSSMDVEVADPAYNVTTKRFGFRLLRRTSFSSFNASPEPVRKGRYVTVTATLKRADWDRYAYVGYSSQRVAVQFKAKGASTWKTVKTVTVGKGSEAGKLSTTVKASGTTGKDGTYRLSYAGNSVSSSATSVRDYVDVR